MSTSSGMTYSTIEALPVRLGLETIIEEGSAYSVTTTYINRTKRKITLVQRDGVRVVQPPQFNKAATGELIIRRRYSLSIEMLEALRDDLSRRASREDVLLSRLRDTFNHTTDVSWGGRRAITAALEFTINEAELDAQRGRCYFSDLDLLVEWTDLQLQRIPHPHSREERAQSRLEGQFTGSLGERTLAFSLRAIDNSGLRRISDRYINLGGLVYQIPIEQDPSLEDGMHVTSRVSISERLQPEYQGQQITQEHLSFEEADKRFFLFDTIEKAQNHGTAADIVKDQINQATAKLKLDEAMLRQELFEKEAELERLKQQINRDKFNHDYLSNEAKGFVEWLKLIGATMGVVVTVIGLAQKLKPS